MWEDPFDVIFSLKKQPPPSTNLQDPFDEINQFKKYEPEITPLKYKNKFYNVTHQGLPDQFTRNVLQSKFGKKSLSLLGTLAEGLAGITYFPMTRHVKQATRVMKGKEKPSISKFIKEGLPIPWVGEKVWGEDILTEAGMEKEGWAKTALGLGLDVFADPITYITGGEAKIGRLARLASTAKKGSKVAKQIAKYERGGKLLPALGKTTTEQIKLGQRGFRFAGKTLFTETQSKIYGKVLNPIKEGFLQGNIGKMASTKYGSPEVRAVHEMFLNEVHNKPEIISNIQKGLAERTKVTKQLAKKYNADPHVLERHLNYLCETKPPMDAPAFIGIEYKLDDMIDPSMLNTLREDTEAIKFATNFKNEMARMGATEVRAGVLKPSQLIETDEIDYLSHLLTPEAKKAVKMADKKGFSRKLINIFHPSAKHRTLLIPSDPANKILSDALPKMKWADKKKLLEAGIIKYPSVAEANKLAREGILIPGKQIEQFFYEDPAKIMAIRQMRSEKALSSARILENARDTGLKEGWAKPFKRGDALEEGWDFVSSPLTNDVVVRSDVAEILNATYSTMMGKNINPLLMQYKKALQWWKVWTLMPFPSYHFRNVFGGNLFNQTLAGMNPLTESWFAKNGANHLAIRVQKINAFKAKGIPITSSKIGKALEKTMTTSTGVKYTLNEIDDLAKHHGIYRAGQYTADVFEDNFRLGRGTKSLNPFKTHNILTEGGMKVGSALEDNAKLGMFIWGLKNGENPVGAAKLAHKFIFDYFDIPPLIKGAKNFLPFITWYYKNIPLQLEFMAKKPRFFTGIYKTKRAISSGKEPGGDVGGEFYERSFPVAIKKKEEKLTWFPLERWLPTADINMLDIRRPLQFGKDWASMAWPGVKAPVELMFKKDLYFGQPIAEKGKERRVQMFGKYIPDWAAYALRQHRLPSTLDRLNPLGVWGSETKKGLLGLGQKRGGKFEPPEALRWLREITGVKFYETDIKRNIDERIRKLHSNKARYSGRIKWQADEKEKDRLRDKIRKIEDEIKYWKRYKY